MKRIACLGLSLLIIACAQDYKPKLETRRDSGSRSIDESQDYIRIEWIEKVTDNGSSNYFLLWKTNLSISHPIKILNSDSSLSINDPSSEKLIEVDREAFESLSRSKFKIVNSDTGSEYHSGELHNAGILGRAPYPRLGDRQIINCDQPQISWLDLNPQFSVDIHFEIEDLNRTAEFNQISDNSPWNAGFSSGDIYAELNPNSEDLIEIMKIKISRYIPEQEAKWYGPNENLDIKVHVLSTLNQDYYFFYFGDC